MLQDVFEQSDLNQSRISRDVGVGNMNIGDDGGSFPLELDGMTHGDWVRELGQHYSPYHGVNRHLERSS